MSKIWQLQEAKSRRSEVVDKAQREAQTITRRGKPVAVVLSAEAYALLQPKRGIVDVLRSCPLPHLVVERLKDAPRSMSL